MSSSEPMDKHKEHDKFAMAASLVSLINVMVGLHLVHYLVFTRCNLYKTKQKSQYLLLVTFVLSSLNWRQLDLYQYGHERNY